MESHEVGDAREHPHLPKIDNVTSHEASAVVPPTTFDNYPTSTEVQPPPHGEQIDTSKSQDIHSLTQHESGQSQSIRNGNGISTSNGEQTSTNAGSSTAGDTLTSSLQHVPYISYPGIEVDSNLRAENSDADSAIGSMLGSSTVSLRESVFSYVEENGRTYHAFHAGKYIGPNDEKEQERLDLQHHLFVMTMNNKLHLAPITNPQNVLDIATGTGIWAIEFAQEYPSASVLGTDLSPIQPLYVPPNCRFEINDAEEEWIFTQPFDYIHGRALVSCFRDPPSVIASIYESLTPGGYFEFQDPIMPLKSIDGTLEGTALDEFQKSCMEAAAKLGRPWTNGKNYGKWMRERGFEDVVEKSYYWATNGWVRGKQQKLQALWLQENLKEGLPAWGLSTLSRGLGWSRDRIEILIARAREDLRDPNIHAFAECYVCYGRKPGGKDV